MASAGGSNTPLLDYESGVLPLHYTSGEACGLVGSKWHVDAATRTRDLGPGRGAGGSRMYDDMRRIRSEVLPPLCHEIQ